VKRSLINSAAFIRAAKRITKRNPQAAVSLRETLLLLELDAFDPRLRTHKLKGELTGSWSASGGYDLRVVFEFVLHNGLESILLVSVGTHDEVY
jgi:mRNA-degrading endonuclease YafQ of YafQ-DinJ toxin-antitoxin module